MKRKNNAPVNGDELPIRNSTAELLFFANDSGSDRFSVRNSTRATQFLSWATGVLCDFALRGYVLGKESSNKELLCA